MVITMMTLIRHVIERGGQKREGKKRSACRFGLRLLERALVVSLSVDC